MVNPKTTEFIKNLNYKIMALAHTMESETIALSFAKDLCLENLEWLKEQEKQSLVDDSYEPEDNGSEADQMGDYMEVAQ